MTVNDLLHVSLSLHQPLVVLLYFLSSQSIDKTNFQEDFFHDMITKRCEQLVIDLVVVFQVENI